MMNQGLEASRAETLLREAMTSTLADMAFLDALPAPLSPPAADAKAEYRAAIDALKPTSCRIELRATSSFCARVASILFADDEGGAAQDDALLEILNIATGKFLTDYFGPGNEVKLELPRFIYFDEGEEGSPIAAFGLDVEGESLTVSLSAVRYRY
jgi:hypothetical protein